MEKFYNHLNYEGSIYSLWEKSGALTPKIIAGVKPFTIIMPPPNANDNLHIGHARFIAIEDTLARYFRLKGLPTLWLPGADHAGIETQFVFEKKLKKEGKSRFDYGREELYQMIWNYVFENKKNMEDQLRALGASCDWTRNRFTLDQDIVHIVYDTFKSLNDDGLIYRGERIVNYCPRCGTAFSQLEVESEERTDTLYYLDYGTIKIATSRPETIFADVAVAVNPKNTKYQNLIGTSATIPLIGRQIPIIEDELVDKDFGTGALKITPGHDILDFEIGQKHNLQTISLIDESGRMINTPEKYIGLKADKAREEVVKDLEEIGAIVKTESLKHVVGICYRDKGILEPMISKQWFIKVDPLSKRALAAINNKEVRFASKRYEKIAKHWLKNLRDWNISRQIVWGIRIPAFRCEKCMEWTITDGVKPDKCKCGGVEFVQDTDTFDTWFSSGQWPFATLKSFSEKDFEYFYPTSVMETAYDILPFWVIRMIMLGLYRTGKVPFENVLIHGLVRDKDGQKISKSKGNAVNPLEMATKYGADAVRMSLIWGALVENDIALSEDNIRGQRNFANKIWNISRFVFMGEKGKKVIQNEDDKWILSEFKKTAKKVSLLIEKYRLNEAAELLYDFTWHKLADTYLERIKDRRDSAQQTLETVLEGTLIMLHPFMPFVTEAIWQEGKDRFKGSVLISASWPK
jgi:valyl-tRNA synthetase